MIRRSDAEIARYVAAEILAGRVRPECGQTLERILRDESDGKCVVMRDPRKERVESTDDVGFAGTPKRSWYRRFHPNEW